MSHRTMSIAGWVLSALFALFMLGASALPKLAGMPIAQDTMAGLGWADSPILLIGVLEAACAILYLIPATSFLGAVLMMAILGGAMATQIRAHSPLASHTLFSIYLGVIMWGGLWLRSPALRAVFPFRR